MHDEDDAPTLRIQPTPEELARLRRDSSVKTRVAAARARDSASDAAKTADAVVESVRASWRPPG